MPQLHTWQPLSMCPQNSVRGRLENSFHQDRNNYSNRNAMLFPVVVYLIYGNISEKEVVPTTL